MFGMDRHVFSEIVKYDGRVAILQDGSRWEVDAIDADVCSIWDYGDHVVVIDDECGPGLSICRIRQRVSPKPSCASDDTAARLDEW